ncbi:unnamed protein product [Penicillium salamii]|nr:unnamed protein product [Penicillium salamii]
MEKKEHSEDLAGDRSHFGEGESHMVAHDAVFGNTGEDGPDYRSLGWLGTSALMMKTQIGLGVLSIPAAFDMIGIVPGVLCLLAVACITTWSDYIVGAFKLRHRDVYGIDDAMALIFGNIGREIFGLGFLIYLVFAAGSGMLGISICLNAVSTHGACTAIFVAIAAVVVFCLGSIQTLGRISWLAWVGLISLLVAIFMVTIAVGVQDRPAGVPSNVDWSSDFEIVKSPKFSQAVSSISTFVFAYAGTPVFFPIVAEMRDPRHFTRSLLLCQSIVTATYVTVGCIVYYYCGSHVASPALGSAGKLIKQISYGIALPGLFVSSTLNTHVASKHVFVRLLRGSRHLSSNSLTHWVVWISCTFSIAIVAYVIASGIPVFNDLVSLIGALLGTLQSFQPMGCMWLYDNWGKGKQQRTLGWTLMVCWSVFVIISGSFLMVAGTYGSVVGIVESFKAEGGSKAWTCSDNSNSV